MEEFNRGPTEYPASVLTYYPGRRRCWSGQAAVIGACAMGEAFINVEEAGISFTGPGEDTNLCLVHPIFAGRGAVLGPEMYVGKARHLRGRTIMHWRASTGVGAVLSLSGVAGSGGTGRSCRLVRAGLGPLEAAATRTCHGMRRGFPQLTRMCRSKLRWKHRLRETLGIILVISISSTCLTRRIFEKTI